MRIRLCLRRELPTTFARMATAWECPQAFIVSNQLNVHPSRVLATLPFRSFSRSAKALQPNSGPMTGNPEVILKLALTGLSRLRRGLGIENDFSQRVKLRKYA